jgi:hypothetical protein
VELADAGEGEEEEGDLVYECPGLAPHGEMVVTNPFFLRCIPHHSHIAYSTNRSTSNPIRLKFEIPPLVQCHV